MEKKKNYTPFSKNLKNYILSNDITRQEFADRLNKCLQGMASEVKIYDSNDIWTYDSRGSFPKDGRVLVAISKVIGKPLENLLTKEYTMDELCVNKKEVLPTTVADILTQYNVNESYYDEKRLNALSENIREFIRSLLVDDGLFHVHYRRYTRLFDAYINYNNGENITATIRAGYDRISEIVLQWSREEFGKELKQFAGDKCRILKAKIEREIFQKLTPFDMDSSVKCSPASVDELPKESKQATNDYYVCETVLHVRDIRAEMNSPFWLSIQRERVQVVKDTQKRRGER